MLATKSHSANVKSTTAPEKAKVSAQQASQTAVNPAWTRMAFGIQRHATVTAPNDPYEQEADAVAERVMRMAEPTAIQRKCACGGGDGGAPCSCHAHDDDHAIQAKRTAAVSTTSSQVSGATATAAARTANAGGTPLPRALRSYFEPRFGHDFSQVRVHTDSGAATAARGIQARAYTLGRDVVFGAGEYAPATEGGKRLLAHELTHVVQQTGGAPQRSRAASATATTSGVPAIQRAVARTAALDSSATAMIAAARDSTSDAGVRAVALVWKILGKYFPAESKGLWVNVVSYEDAVPGLSTSRAGTGATSQGKIVVGKDFREQTTEGTFEARVADVGRTLEQIELWRRGTAAPGSCEPSRRLTWADFKGPVGSYGAFTGFDHTLETVNGEQIVRATFAPARSYVKPDAKDPANRATSGCGAVIKQCETMLAGKTGVTLPLAADGHCAAGPRPDPRIVATSSAECSSVLGPECDRVRQLESERLLRHEQLHFDIACALARKGTRAISLKPSESARILQAVKDKAHELSNDGGAYDSETDHGCNAAPQAAWDQSVGAGMPMVVIS
jgi:hypothetical protein